MFATIYGHIDCVKCLVKDGAGLDLVDIDKKTALIHAKNRLFVEIEEIIQTATQKGPS